MDEIDESLRKLSRRYEKPPPSLDVISARVRREPSTRRPAKKASASVLVMALTFGAFGLGVAAAHSDRFPFTQKTHDAVPLATSAACATARASTTVSASSGPVGTTVTVSGPVYYLNEDGDLWVPQGKAIQVWWGLDPVNWADATPPALAAAQGQTPVDTASGGHLVGQYGLNGACSFAAGFAVPDVKAGTYPVSVLVVAPTGGVTLYGSFQFAVS